MVNSRMMDLASVETLKPATPGLATFVKFKPALVQRVFATETGTATLQSRNVYATRFGSELLATSLLATEIRCAAVLVEARATANLKNVNAKISILARFANLIVMWVSLKTKLKVVFVPAALQASVATRCAAAPEHATTRTAKKPRPLPTENACATSTRGSREIHALFQDVQVRIRWSLLSQELGLSRWGANHWIVLAMVRATQLDTRASANQVGRALGARLLIAVHMIATRGPVVLFLTAAARLVACLVRKASWATPIVRSSATRTTVLTMQRLTCANARLATTGMIAR
jgi:hypothetical protein